MKSVLLSALVLGAMTAGAWADSTTSIDAPADSVVLERISQTNRGGNEPQGEAKGVPATNPAGKAPPGQNK